MAGSRGLSAWPPRCGRRTPHEITQPVRVRREEADRGGLRAGAGQDPTPTSAPCEFEGGAFPTEESVELIYDELDLQRATQAYMDFFPSLSLYGIVRSQIRDFGFTSLLGRGRDGRLHAGERELPDRQQQHRLRLRLARPEGRRAHGGRDPARHVRQRQRRDLQVPHRLRPDGPGQGQGRQVPLPAPRLRGQGAGRLLRVPRSRATGSGP